METMRVLSAQEIEQAEGRMFMYKVGTVILLGIGGSSTCFYALVVGSGQACLIGFAMMAFSAGLSLYWLYKAADG